MNHDPAALARWYARRLDRAYPDAGCALRHTDPWQLLVATILSAQCTDERVNAVTPGLFRRFPDPAAMAAAPLEEIEALIRSTGFFRNKAKHLRGSARILCAEYGGVVPADMKALLSLPGVARKTANVVLGTAFGRAEGVVVDTHVKRLSFRMGLTRHADPAKVERDLMERFPKRRWILLSHQLILHGRALCRARRPACAACPLASRCPRAGVGE